jgi:pimeloyl-ACP methyl ester carboxylesterase
VTPPAHPPDVLRIDVGDTELGVIRWSGDPGTPVVFAVHGITANAWSWSAVARHLDGEVGLVAIDLRGRGISSAAPGPYGMRRHGDDLATIVERLNAAPAAVVGHSMGASVALAAAERHPAIVDELVLVDGGAALDLPKGMSPQDALEALAGSVAERLRKVWTDRVSYRTMWHEHPAFADGLTPEIERYVLSDLVECEGGFRSIVDEAAVRFDGEELFTDDEMRTLLDRRQRPVTVIRAETGLMATPPPLMPAELIDRFPQHDWRTIQGTNHYTVLIGEQGAAAIAEALIDTVNSRA